jgi:glutaminyl-peptide cyclotransferase
MLLVHSFNLLVFLLLALPADTYGSMLGERDLGQLSLAQISLLISSPDPVINLNPVNPESHLSKILIPRPRKSSVFSEFVR